MRKIWMLACLLSLVSPALAGTENLSAAASGGMISLVTRLADAYMASHTGDRIEVAQKPIESTGGIRITAEGRLGMGMVARPLKAAELQLGLHATEIARAPLVFGVNRSVEIPGISEADVCRLFRGEFHNGSELGAGGGRIRVRTRPDGDSTKRTVRNQLPCFSDLKEPSTVVVMPQSRNMKKSLSRQAGSIGMLDIIGVSDSHGLIGALPLDGVAPDSPAYPIFKSFNRVTRAEPGGLGSTFLRFIRSDRGGERIRENHALPVNPS